MGRSNRAARWRALQMLRLGKFQLSVSVHPGCAALSVRGSSNGRRIRRPAPRHTGARSVSYEWYGNNCGSGTLSVHFPHDRNAHRIRALFHRPAGSGRPAPGAPGAWRRRGSHLHRSRPHRHDPRPPRPRPGPRRRARRRHAGRAETQPAGKVPSRMPAPSPIGFGNEA